MPDRQRHDCAVALCVDRKFFPLALFVCRQIVFHNPNRRFDLLIVTRDALEMPAWADPLGILLHQTGAPPDSAIPATRRLGSETPLYRLALARELGDRYRRILYIDSDIFVEGGDLSRLMQVDMGPHPIAATLDAPFLYDAAFHAHEFRRTGLPRAPYCNTGVQVIDTRAYVEQEVEQRSLDSFQRHPDAIIYTDQSLTNLALRGGFAHLAPCWNWQNNLRLPLMVRTYPVFVRHFIGPRKPDRQALREQDARFALAYRDYFAQFFPEALDTLAPLPDPTPLRLREMLKILVNHVQSQKIVAAEIARFPDPYRAIA